MPDILGVTNPVPGHDNALINRNLPTNPSQTQIQNVPDPSRVTRSDNRSERQDTAAGDGSVFRFDSNYSSFLQRLNESSDLPIVLMQLLSGRSGTIISSGIGEGTAAEMAQFMSMLQMDEGQFAAFLSNQFNSGARFSGPLFSILRGAYQSADTEGLRADILQFLKHYSDNSSSRHIEGNMLRNLNAMARSIPARWGERLLQMTEQLQESIASGDRAGSLKLLQGKILPFMSDYVARTHDFGHARDLLTQLTLDISRYESGSDEFLLQAFHQLKNCPALREKLGSLDDAALLRLLRESGFAQAAKENEFADQLAAAAKQAMHSSDADTQAAFRELVSAMLVNESVYMPLNHFLIPLDWNGKMMFSEMWVDPNDDSGESSRKNSGEHGLRFLFKLDIHSVGFFDIVLAYRQESVSLQVQCPEKVAQFSDAISHGLHDILTRNGLKSDFIEVRQMEKPMTITQVFPKLFTRRDSIDVKV